MATTFNAVSQSFGAPRDSSPLSWARRAWQGLMRGLGPRPTDDLSPEELMELADMHESTSPSLAADLRAAALLALSRRVH